MFEAWFQIWIPNTQSRLHVQKHYYILWIKNLTSIACLKRGFAFESHILNRGFVLKSIASLCEYILTWIACLKHGFTNTESIEASCSKALLHFVNKKLNLDCVFEVWFRIWIPNTRSRLLVQKSCYTFWIKNLTKIVCLTHGFANTESIEASCSNALLHLVNKTQKRCLTLWIKKLNFEAWFRIQNKRLIVGVDSWSLTFVELVAPKRAVVLLFFVSFIYRLYWPLDAQWFNQVRTGLQQLLGVLFTVFMLLPQLK